MVTPDSEEVQIILVCGIPASGKSEYGKWLAREKGFLHLDVEKPGELDRAGLKAEWDHIFTPRGSTKPFLKALRKTGQPVVIDWGFPPECLSVVRALQQEGIEIWWFDGDRVAAQQCFTQRAVLEEKLTRRFLEERIKQFERQMSLIEKEWSKIQAIVGSRRIEALRSGPTYISPERIFVRMFGSASAQIGLIST